MRVVYAGSRCAATTDTDEKKLPEGKPEERLPEWCSEEFKAWWWRNCAWVTSAGYEGDEIPTLYQAYEVRCITGLYLCAATLRVTHVCSVGGGCRVGVATAQVYRKEVALERQAELLATLDPEVPAVKAILEHDWSADAAKLGVDPEQMQQNVRATCVVHSAAPAVTGVCWV